MQTVKNVFNNVSPIRTYNAGSDFKETATHVVPEVVVQRVVSKMFGKGAPQPILDSALMHALSVPWVGAFAFFGPKFHPTLSGDYTKQFTAGAAGIPAVLFARYLIELIGGEKSALTLGQYARSSSDGSIKDNYAPGCIKCWQILARYDSRRIQLPSTAI